jgi:Domain of unknown function (DUF4136)
MSNQTPCGHHSHGRLGHGLTALAIAAGVIVAVQSGAAKVKTRADFDKTFDFQQAHTFGWTSTAGHVIAARTPDDDPEAIRKMVEPVIMNAVSAEMPQHGLTAAAAAPDLTLTYYLLLTVGSSAQTMGQFLPPVAQWGLPPFAPTTTAIKVIQQGALVLDLASKGEVVWRGVGEAEIKIGLETAKRAELTREAVQEILKKYPPKK